METIQLITLILNFCTGSFNPTWDVNVCVEKNFKCMISEKKTVETCLDYYDV